MLAGFPPFFDQTPTGIYEKILACKITFPIHIDPCSIDFIKRLLTVDITRRLGNLKYGTIDVKLHKYFKNIVWEDVLNRVKDGPIVPILKHAGDTGNFDDYSELTEEEINAIEMDSSNLFLGF